MGHGQLVRFVSIKKIHMEKASRYFFGPPFCLIDMGNLFDRKAGIMGKTPKNVNSIQNECSIWK